ncbi:TIGR01777 family protein [Cryomorpha ignava]|uniref:TIGR01777 family protein n=1 Tax=Cryomorpha ignava TaxID=101383 RepID=A0A7K3WTH7_9FLAO|nr:TIGR01777 family oxidoreductase [Cryomorpha ignava]NEN24331.1 TIGR01777 family protein [Cryomorpha ignava]
MKITIAGGSGFLGQSLKKHFRNQNHEVLVLARAPEFLGDVLWNGKDTGGWCKAIDGFEVLINLSGKSVDCRYTDKNKKSIFSSRIEPTTSLHDYILTARAKPKIWLNASSATAYIHAETEQMTESKGRIGDDFSMNVWKEWEHSFFAKKYPEMRQVAMRTSIVLGDTGGAFPKLRRVTKLGLGGKLGPGNQMVSWIHITDFCRAIDFIIENESLKGIVNITSPNPLKNKDMMRFLRKKCNMPFGLNQPVAMLEFGALIIGTETELLLKSRNVYPEKLQNEGFKFHHPRIEDALLELA